MGFDFNGWDIHVGEPHPFNDRSPKIDNGAKRVDPSRFLDTP